MRDKLIGLAVVIVVAGLIWYVAKLRAAHTESHTSDAALVVAPHAVHDAFTPRVTPTYDDASIVDAETFDATLELTPACRALVDASQRPYDEARDAGYCIDFTLDELRCKTSTNGATWGLRVDDVTDLEVDAASCPTGWLVRVVHVAADQSQQTIVPPGPGGVRNGHPYNVYKAAPVSIATFFDWDGDGEDEIVVTRWTSTFVYTFKHGHIVSYAPASRLSIANVDDIDSDGRPDFIIKPFGDAPPTTLEFVAHSLADGTFTLHDAVAIGRAQSMCPVDAPIALGASEEVLANDIACALVWGHDPTTLRKQLCDGGDSATCFPWVKPMLATKAPLTLR